MMSFCRLARVSLAGLLIGLLDPAWAQVAEPNPAITASAARIQISYDAPSNPALLPFYNALREHHVLERVQAFMVPLRLPEPVIVRTAQCGSETEAYNPGGAVTICYEMVQHVAAIAAAHTKDPQEQALILDGTFVEAVLHDLAYAIFYELKVPIWGREDDAADHIAALIMTSFGDRVGLTTILGTAMFFEYSGQTWTGADFASPDSPDAQRFYNFLCIAYGADPITFGFLRPTPGPSALPKLTSERAARCSRDNPANEYLQVRQAFNLRIMPYVDPELLIKVRASQWMSPGEMSEAPK